MEFYLMEMINVEFIINKIDTDVRVKIQEETSAEKVHSGKSINVNKDLKDEAKTDYKRAKENSSIEKKYITIDGVKDFNEKIAIEVEKIEKINDENSRGTIVDSTK
jgi:hypothetical protein